MPYPVMSKADCLTLIVVPQVPLTDLRADDGHVAGVYSILVNRDVTRAQQAALAIDAFFGTLPIRQPDDFSVYAVDPITHFVIDPDPEHEEDTFAKQAFDLQRVGDQIQRLFDGKIYAQPETGEPTLVAETRLFANTWAEARGALFAEYWDSRLDAASCSPDYRIEAV